MGAGVNAELAAELDTAAQPTSIEIEPTRRATDLDRNTILGASGQHGLEIQVIAWEAHQRYLTNHGDEGVGGAARLRPTTATRHTALAAARSRKWQEGPCGSSARSNAKENGVSAAARRRKCAIISYYQRQLGELPPSSEVLRFLQQTTLCRVNARGAVAASGC